MDSTRFQSSYHPPSPWPDSARLFLFRNDDLLVKELPDACIDIPTSNDVPELCSPGVAAHFFGTLDDVPCFASAFPPGLLAPGALRFRGLRSLFGVLEDDEFAASGRALQIVHWDETNRFCGRCGSAVTDREEERAKECSRCGLVSYPRISPASIVAVTRGKAVLLAHSPRHAPHLYSLIAGFVEIGETLEQCAIREVKEEVGLEIDDLRYFSSQPWALSNSLMVAFTARYVSGEIKVDGREVTDAGWFTIGNLPGLPSKMSIARRLIDFLMQTPAAGKPLSGLEPWTTDKV